MNPFRVRKMSRTRRKLGFRQAQHRGPEILIIQLEQERLIVLSLCQLKRILARRGIRRRNNTSDVDTVLKAVETELNGSGRIIGYRGMWQRLQQDRNLVIGKFIEFPFELKIIKKNCSYPIIVK